MKDSLAKTSADRAKLDSYLVGKDKVIGFLEEIEKTGSALGVAVKIDSVADGTFAFASSTSPVFRVSLEASGSWKQTFLLAEEIRALPHKIAFTSLSLLQTGAASADKSAKPAASGAPQWLANMEIVAARSN